jgi:hypothetical protein
MAVAFTETNRSSCILWTERTKSKLTSVTGMLWKAFEGRGCLRQFIRADINVRRPTEACILNSDSQLDYIDVVVKVVELKSRAQHRVISRLGLCRRSTQVPAIRRFQ